MLREDDTNEAQERGATMTRRLAAWIGILLVAVAAMPTSAAGAFAAPAFAARWNTGEQLVPNYWGPLANARDGQTEPYAEAPGGMRTVQYFDKGRMELTADGTVTSGLLAQELVEGRVQTGNGIYESRPAYVYPIVGDPRTSGATYADAASNAGGVRSPLERRSDGKYTTQRIGPSNDPQAIAAFDAFSRETGVFTSAVYDEPTKQYAIQVFVDYRDRVGFDAIGYAISNPIYEVVPIGGREVPVVYQIFQRRVLTFNRENPDNFKVEMGNTGQHYYEWRYGGR